MIQEFLAQHGDGGKQLLLMLAAGVRAALREAPSAQHAQPGVPRFARLSHGLAALQVGHVCPSPDMGMKALLVGLS